MNLLDLAKAMAAIMKQNSSKPVMTLSRAMLYAERWKDASDAAAEVMKQDYERKYRDRDDCR